MYRGTRLGHALQCRVIPASLHYHARAGQAFLQSKGGARLALFWHWSASCPTGRRHDPPVMAHRLMLDSDPKIRLAQNHCPLHSPFRSESSPRTQGVEFFVIGRLSSAATSRGERLEDSFNPLTYSQNWDFGRFTLLLAIFGSIGRRSPFRNESSPGVELRGLSAQTSGGMLQSSSIHHYTTLQTLNILQMIAQEIRAVPRQLARHRGIPPNPLS